MPELPCAFAHGRIPRADGQHHAFHGPGRPIPGYDIAAPLFLRAVSRAAACRQSARAEYVHGHRHPARTIGAREAPMSTTAQSSPARWRRFYDFGLELWGVLRRPSTVFSLGTLVLAGFVAGVVFWGGFNTAMELTNREVFCVSCHEMRDNVFEDLKRTAHYTNRSGVRATCPDCHVPHEWTHKLARKMQASKEVW